MEKARAILEGFHREPDYDPTYARHVTTLRDMVGWTIVPSLVHSSDPTALRNLVDFIEHIASDGDDDIDDILESSVLPGIREFPRVSALELGPSTQNLI